MNNIKETEYVYAAARIHVHDGSILNRDALVRLANSPDIDSLIALLG